jgi:uncharacterized membrane protein YfcA
MTFDPVFIISGLIVGFIVGMTGVGGGSLMTPILLWFGISPTTAVGTDLLYAAITKGGGVVVHQRHSNINWRITAILAAGSVPAALITLLILKQIGFESGNVDSIIKTGLGITLILTALSILFKNQLIRYSHDPDAPTTKMSGRRQDILTWVTGLILGAVVTVTSIGAGALGTVALFMLYPKMRIHRLVGTEIAHAVPLTLVAGLGHAGLGNVDWPLLINLLMGSLPGIWVGSHLTGSVPDKFLRPALAGMLILVGLKLVAV